MGADVLLAVGLAAVGFVETTVALGAERTSAWPVPLAMAAPLIWRRDRPHLVALAVTLVLVVQLPLPIIRVFDQTFAGYACLFVAVYSVGRYGGRWKLPVASLSATLAGLTIGLYDGNIASGGLAVALVIAPAFVGHAVEKRIRLRELLEAQAAELEAGSLVETAAEAAATRTRIAGEVEDVVHRRVHDMAERAMLAGRQATSDPQGAARAVEGIEIQGREALAEMRGLVGVLRAAAVPTEPPQVEVEAADTSRHTAALDGALRRADPWLTLALIAFTAAESAMAASTGTMPVAAVVGAAMAAPLLARRRFPVSVSATGWGVAAVMALGLDLPLTSLALLAPLYAYAAGASTSRYRRAGLAVGLAGVAAVNVLSGSAAWGDYVLPAMLVVLGWLAGSLLAEHGRMTVAAAARTQDLQHLRAIRTRTAAVEERLRIARELHDVAAHTLMIMVVQSGAARRSLESGRDGWTEALEVVSRTGSAASTELQRLLALVRPESASDAPASGLGQVRALVEPVRAAGVAVDLEMEGPTDAVPHDLQLAAYRIVQEALTNVVRHADASRVSVLVRRDARGLTLEISDDGRQPAGDDGNGIAGMRERARIHGGDLYVGPRPGGGFRVAVTFPVGAMTEARTA